MSIHLPSDAPDSHRSSGSAIPEPFGDRPAPSSDNPLLSRIIVVDDSPENVRLLLRILRRGGYTEVTGVTDPRAALERVKELVPNLVIVDLHMPYVDGYGVMQEIRSALPHRPKFLLVTGEIEEDVRSVAVARGADDVVIKPFQVEDLLRRVGMLLVAQIRPGTGGSREQ